jgi:hypothetical protein
VRTFNIQRATLEAETRPSSENQTYWSLDVTLPGLEAVRKLISVLHKLSSLWFSVIAAQNITEFFFLKVL